MKLLCTAALTQSSGNKGDKGRQRRIRLGGNTALPDLRTQKIFENIAN